MRNKVVVVTSDEIAFSGTVIGGDFIDQGVLFQPSEQSGITIWFPINEIIRVIFGNADCLEEDDMSCLYNKLYEYNEKYKLNELGTEG